MKEYSVDELNRLYKEAEQCDKDLFSEQRTNILLSAGEHYSKSKSTWWNRIRDSKELSNEQKLRLTKNHIYKVVRGYVNNIVSQSPGVIPTPNNPKEIQDQKSAELNKSVWQYAKQKHRLNIEIQKWAKDFIEIGEVAVKIYWDPNQGRFLGMQQAVDEQGQPQVDEQGQMVASETGVFSGDLCIERLFGFNLLRAPEAKSMHESPYLINRKMVYLDDLKKIVKDEETQKKLSESKDETFFIFDPNKLRYQESSKQTMVKEFYFKPCPDYPNGYYYIATQTVKLFEGELPYGIYPIIYEGFDEISTTPRHRSLLKQLRPYQIEINRAYSKMAEHQVTLGDDKVILLNGSKYTSGPHVPGIRVAYVTGQAPTVLEGRSGDQYLNYGQSQIAELYQVANMQEDNEEIQQGADPYANLYRSIKDKKKFKIYTDKFENFQTRVCETYLDLARNYFDENMLVPMVGKSEYVNISEFKNTTPICYQIKIEPLSDDIESMMGKHLVFNHILQYVGSTLDKDSVGKILKQMPFMNHEGAFDNLTIDEDTATNVVLALDRGQQPILHQYDNVEYIGKKITSRMKSSDFQMLDPNIQNSYQALLAQCEQIGADQLAQIKSAESEFIPSGGGQVKCDFYVPDPKNPQNQVRATVPTEAMDWLIKRLAEQGSAQEVLQEQAQPVQSDIARMLLQHQGLPAQGSAGVPPNMAGMPGVH